MTNIMTTTSKSETLTSIEVAQMVGKEHKDLLRDIRRYVKQLNQTNLALVKLGQSKIAPSDFFTESTYVTEQNKTIPCYQVTRKGCEFIANKLTGQKGTEFTARFVNRFHELEEMNTTNILLQSLATLSESMVALKNDMDNRLSNLESKNEMQETKKIPSETLHKKPFNPWFARMSPKYTLLEEYFDITRGQLYRNILLELENLYDLDTQQIQADYCYENNLTSCYPLDPYQFNKRYRDAIELLVNDTLTKYGIVSEDNPIATRRHQTIFDKPVMKCI
jgi:Rha family phage regulatory protein